MLKCDCNCHEWIWFTHFLATSNACRRWSFWWITGKPKKRTMVIRCIFSSDRSSLHYRALQELRRQQQPLFEIFTQSERSFGVSPVIFGFESRIFLSPESRMVFLNWIPLSEEEGRHGPKASSRSGSFFTWNGDHWSHHKLHNCQLSNHQHPPSCNFTQNVWFYTECVIFKTFTLFCRVAIFVENLRTFECKIFRPKNVLV